METRIFKEIKKLNEMIKDLFIFLLCREGFGQKEIRSIFGKIDNTRITKISSGIKKVAAQKIKNNKK